MPLFGTPGGNTKGYVSEWIYESPTQLKSSLNVYLLSGMMIACFGVMATLGANDEDMCPLADGKMSYKDMVCNQ